MNRIRQAARSTITIRKPASCTRLDLSDRSTPCGALRDHRVWMHTHEAHRSCRHGARRPHHPFPAVHRSENPRTQYSRAVSSQCKKARDLDIQTSQEENNEFSEKAEDGAPLRAEKEGPLRRLQIFARNELKALVDYYGLDMENGKEIREETFDHGLLQWNTGDDHVPNPVKHPADTNTIARLEKLLQSAETPHEQIYHEYKLLSSPGVVYLRIGTIRRLLRHLSIVERPTPATMQRYLSILQDMHDACIHLTRSEWTSAIYLAGTSMGKITDDEVFSALRQWRDMEVRAGLRGSVVTFHVLFHIAVKANKLALADMLLREFRSRRMQPHRHLRISLLYYYGVQRDGEAIRRTYKELVDAGEIVDTVVMNAVIAALLRAGEPSAAEHVFLRMQQLHASRYIPFMGGKTFNTLNWRGRRLNGIHLTQEGRRMWQKGKHEKHRELQDIAPIAPNSRTYSLLIRYHARVAGDLDRVIELIREMGYEGIPMEGSIFVVMFHGFCSHGGIRYSSWTSTQLEQTWTEYLKAVESKLERTWISKMAVVSALRAFKKCSGANRVLRAWDEVKHLWDPSEQELDEVLKVLQRLAPSKPGFFSAREYPMGRAQKNSSPD